MNKQNVKKLRDFIKKLPAKAIYMPDFIRTDRKRETVRQALQYTCSTQACIAGWAELLRRDEAQLKSIPKGCLCASCHPITAEWLGLDHCEADSLFFSYWSDRPTADIKKADVLRKLDSMLKTGTV